MIFFFLFIWSAPAPGHFPSSQVHNHKIIFHIYILRSNSRSVYHLSDSLLSWASRTSPFRPPLSGPRIWRMEELVFSYQTWFTSPFPARRILAMFVRFQGQKLLQKRFFKLKERSHKNSFVLTRKLAPKEEEWNSLQMAVNLQTSWNVVIKRELHFSALDFILIWKGKSLKLSVRSQFIFCSFVWYLVWPVSSSLSSPPWASRTPCRPTSSSLRWEWRVALLFEGSGPQNFFSTHLALKEEEWYGLLKAGNFLTSRKFVFKWNFP